MIQLLDGAYVWSSFNAEKKLNFNGHILKTSEGTVIVDPPPFSEEDLAYLAGAGLKPDALVITNRNHLRDREGVLARWKIPTVLHALEVESADITPDKTVVDGDKIHGLICVHLPGKSPGEIALYWPDRRMFLLGDALIAPGGKLKTVPAEKQEDPAALKRSLELLRSYDFDHMLVGDGDPVLGDAKSAVVAFLDKNK
jgi:glyoxylase-like metal-dependent hydrolase (beta-lactamase superfamily II)